MTPGKDKCDWCSGPLEPSWWQRVPGAGDICDQCHKLWHARRSIEQRGVKLCR